MRPRVSAARRFVTSVVTATLVAGLFLVAVAPRPASAAVGTVTNFTAPGIVRPTDIVSGHDGRLAFINAGSGNPGTTAFVGSITSTGSVSVAPASGAGSLTAGPDGHLWMTGYGFVAPLDDAGGSLGSYSVTGASRIMQGSDGNLWVACLGTDVCRVDRNGAAVGDPVLVAPYVSDLAPAPDGTTWVLTQVGYSASSVATSIWRVTSGGIVSPVTSGFFLASVTDMAAGPDGAMWLSADDGIRRVAMDGTITLHASTAMKSPRAIAQGPDGAMWFTNFESDTIGRITMGGAVTTYGGPGLDQPLGITAGSDGAMWFTNYGNSSIGRITTGAATGSISIHYGGGHSLPQGIARGPDGAMWIANMSTSGGRDSIARLMPGGAVSSVDSAQVSRPSGIASGPDGNVWFTQFGDDSIGRWVPGGGLTVFPGNGFVASPGGITAGPDGALWFTNLAAGIGRVSTTGTLSQVSDNTKISLPTGIVAGPDGNLWFTNYGGASIGRVTPGASPAASLVKFTHATISSPYDIARGPDGALWFTNAGNNTIGRITPGGAVTNFADPSISQPFGIAAGPDGALWFTNHGGSSIGRITTAGTVTSYAAGAVSAPTDIAAGPDGAMWFTNEGNSSIGRITVMRDTNAPTVSIVRAGLATGAPLSGSSPRARLTWSASDTGGSGLDRYEVGRSVNGASWTTVQANVRTRSAVVAVSTGKSYRFRIRAVDVHGNVGAWVAGPTFTPALVQGSSASVAYRRTWRTDSADVYSAGSTRYATAAGARATYAFRGRSVAWVTTLGPTRGKAKVYIDGSYVTTVDLRAGSTAYRVQAWQRQWSSAGSHTIRIVVVGTSGRPRIDLDAFAVLK